MAKYIKIVGDSSQSVQDLAKKAKVFASNFEKSRCFVWDTDNTDDSINFDVNNKEPCGKQIGKVNGKPLICGKDDYMCPDCRDF